MEGEASRKKTGRWKNQTTILPPSIATIRQELASQEQELVTDYLLPAAALRGALDRAVITGAASHEEATLGRIAVVLGAMDGMARMVPDFSCIAGTDAVTLMAISPLPRGAIRAVAAIARIGLSVGSD
jgi:hypothetical protein